MTNPYHSPRHSAPFHRPTRSLQRLHIEAANGAATVAAIAVTVLVTPPIARILSPVLEAYLASVVDGDLAATGAYTVLGWFLTGALVFFVTLNQVCGAILRKMRKSLMHGSRVRRRS